MTGVTALTVISSAMTAGFRMTLRLAVKPSRASTPAKASLSKPWSSNVSS